MRDDRGKDIPLVSIRGLRSRAGQPGYPTRQTLDRISLAVRNATRDGGIFSVTSLFAMGVLVVWIIGLIGLRLVLGDAPWTLWIKLGWFISCIAGAGVVPRMHTRRRMARQIAATLVAEGTCGSCGYSVRHIVPDAQGFVTCPECGGAWLASRMTIATLEQIARNLPPLHRRRRFRGRKFIAPDARGRLIPIMDSRLHILTPERVAELGDDAKLLITRLRSVGRTGRLIAAGALCSFTALPIALVAIGNQMDTRDSDPTFAIFGCGFFLLVGAAMFRSELFSSARELRETCVRARRCASCGENLQGTPPEPDAMVNCPRCAAGWRLPRGPAAVPASSTHSSTPAPEPNS